MPAIIIFNISLAYHLHRINNVSTAPVINTESYRNLVQSKKVQSKKLYTSTGRPTQESGPVTVLPTGNKYNG